MVERSKWTPQQIALFNSVWQRLEIDGDVGSLLETRLDLESKTHAPLFFRRRSLLPESPYSRAIQIGAYRRSLPGDDQRRHEVFVENQKVGQPASLAVIRLEDNDFPTIKNVIYAIANDLFFRPPVKAYPWVRRSGIFGVSYYLSPLYGSPFWNPDNIPHLPQRR